MPQVFNDPREMKQDFAFLANSEKNKNMFAKMLAGGEKINPDNVVLPTGCILVRQDIEGEGFNLALLLETEQAVLYYCSVVFVTDEALELSGVTQSLVWRNRMKPAYKRATQDFVRQIFNNYLIENYVVIISDVYHSYGGMFMWQEQLGYAIERKDRTVLIYDQMGATLTPIKKESFDEFLDSLWSEDESRLNIRAVIKKD